MPERPLLVEGKGDMHVMWALFKAHNLPETFRVDYPKDDGAGKEGKDDGGVERLLQSVPTRLKGTGLERLGLIVDADEDLTARWAQVRAVLERCNCQGVPAQPGLGGTIVRVPEGPVVGVWVMPDNRLPGMLESFLTVLAPSQDKLYLHVNQFVDDIPADARRCPAHRLPKARIHAWLAVQEEPGKPLGQALTAKYLDATAEVVQPLLDWVRLVLID
jgi:hypothetical protein